MKIAVFEDTGEADAYQALEKALHMIAEAYKVDYNGLSYAVFTVVKEAIDDLETIRDMEGKP